MERCTAFYLYRIHQSLTEKVRPDKVFNETSEESCWKRIELYLRGVELTFLLSSGESLFIKIDSLKDSLNALFSQVKSEKWLKLLLLCSCKNRLSDIADGLHATQFSVRGDKPICSPDLAIKWCSVLS